MKEIQGKEWRVTISPDAKNRVRKYAQPDEHGRGSILLPSRFTKTPTWSTYSAEAPSHDVRKVLLQQALLTRILHTLYPKKIPDIYRVHTKHSPWHERDFVDGQNGDYKSLAGKAPHKPEKFDFERFLKYKNSTSIAHEALRRFNIETDRGHNNNVVMDEQGNWAYVDLFYMGNPKKTIIALARKIRNVEDPRTRHICVRWLRRLARLTKI